MRLEITRQADLAVRALVALSRSPQRMKSAALAEHLETTSGFVPQVMAPLVRAGWVTSDPGPTGGYRSIVDIDQLDVLRVVEAVDGPTDNGRCVVADRPCDSAAPCAMHVAWTRARRELMDTLRAMPVSSVVAA
ncbi:MAG TPA: Rrf2 family transcriptional regulator [Ilumatobacteraceae bacterium]|mgnify:CR=1 FL=1|nr:Rrf2 family transcriptional regulator [Ilumatobacteraceae bacterium]